MRLVGALVVPLCVSLAICLHAQDRPQAGPASARISGRVVAADSGAPIRGAQVRLRSARGGPDVRLATTDDQGIFDAQNLFAGDWTVTASKNGFITTRYGQRRAADEGTRVTVANGQHSQVSIALARAAAITGRVLDEFGEPLLGAQIRATRSRVVRGTRQLAPVGAGDTTDDTGAFRLFGLSPGTYYVTAMMRASAPDSDIVQGTLGATTYYPGTGDVGEALPVVVRAGDEPSITFQVAPVRSVRVSGMVVGANGAPAPDVEVRLMRLDATEVGTSVGNFGRTAADGSFSIINVPPGQYVLTAVRPLRLTATPTTTFAAAAAMARAEEAVQAVTVGFDDVTGLTVAMTAGVIVSGVVEAENGSRLPSPLNLEVTATSALAMGRGPTVIQVARAAGQRPTFEAAFLFGPVYFGAKVGDGMMLRAIELNGMDVTDRPVELRGPNTPELKIVLSNRVTEVAGVVTDDGTAASSVSVITFPEDPAKWAYPSRFIAYADTDDQGRFTIRQLPPGERYYAAVAVALEDGDQFDPDLLRILRDRATSFTLADGERRQVNLTVGR